MPQLTPQELDQIRNSMATAKTPVVIAMIKAVLAGGIIKGTIGFGMPTVAVPIVAFFIPATTAMIDNGDGTMTPVAPPVAAPPETEEDKNGN